MRLTLQPKNRLLTRVFVTSLCIIALVGFGLAWLINLLHAQNRYNQTTSALIAKLPIIAAEFRENNLVPITQAREGDDIDTQYIMATCNARYDTLWRSEFATGLNLSQICEQYLTIKDDLPPFYLNFNQNQSYFAYLLSIDVDAQMYHLLILQDASELKAELSQFNQLTYFRLAIVLLVALLLLISAAYWSMRPLAQLKLELVQLQRGRKNRLSQDYPEELQGITTALNQLISQADDRQTRYQNAMNDLAHSLKTRLAASIAIIDDNTLERQQQNRQILEQINDMDHLVQYQLKRAMLGQQGLHFQHTELLPIVESLAQMLTKLYQQKHVSMTYKISEHLALPLSKGDVMELLGNLMENGFRLCISQVSVRAHIKDDNKICLSVEDDGPGVDDAIKQKIIQRGIRADTQSPGQGIGLAVCHELVNSYGGTLTINTSKLGGAAFIIELPI
ncbi:ATP-binding protein [Shewanella ulleungensis]|uniref:histidine kinase n=1 Tax=Shewanella ulleungensis TaxID=2282699 RepID=A0ABQ2QKQ9_9GAMM|nr:sensor histidine kinase [Shewanella ulleungensis]MCL1151104.1 sensor histidine kinase [Shewanella ulleungensis]GGP82987.1 sensor histidine kinase [Shewanella ulleungensis]